MKRIIIVLLVSVHLFNIPAFCQSGDFQLNNTNGFRRFEKVSADSSLKGGPFKNLFIGKNYRPEWLQPVTVPVLNLQTDMGGITPNKEGGGKQTRNLQVKDGNGNEWALRSVQKFPEKVVAPELKGTIAEKIIKQGISASYPYAALSVGTLSRAAGVPFLPNALIYIPDDPALGTFRSTYKNSLSLMELRTIYYNGSKEEKTYNSIDVIEKIQKTNANKVDQASLLRARLLDNFIMDFDRHHDQWEWVQRDSGNGKIYYPIPKDRDQAFFDINGIIPRIARYAEPTLNVFQGLRSKARDINGFNNTARDFDRKFLTELDEAAWSREIDVFVANMKDTIIESALYKQPREVHPYNVGKIISLLKEKRAYFKEDMMKYYRFLSKTVSVVGSNDPEQFVITKDADGSLIVHVQKKDSAGSVSATTYHRVFDHIITREIRLYGLEGDDEFIIRGGDNAIQLRLIGGPGDDFFINEGTGGEVLVYDVEYENNKIIGNPGIRNKISDDPLNNEYRQLGNNYNATIPWVAFELTGEGGLFVGPTLEIRTAGFRKDPYASVHYLYATRALSSSSYHLRYDADFFKVRKNTDLLIRTDATLPTVRTYFFGLGNNTFNDPIRDTDPSYYIAQYSRVDMSLMARHAVTKWMNIKWGPVAQYFKLLNNRNRGNYIKTLYPVSSQKGYLYNGLFYGGGEINAQVNTRNHRVFTTQGIHLNIYSRGLRNFSNSSNLRQAGGSVSFFSDFLLKRIIILATSFGADKNFGQFEFPQAQYLGFRQNLRGYRFQRFAGESRAYNNSELRINFGTANFYFFKGLTGLVAFHDIGRVWAKGETSNTLHRGYGAGLWVAPFDKLVFITSVASSKEEKAWLQFTFGFQF